MKALSEIVDKIQDLNFRISEIDRMTKIYNAETYKLAYVNANMIKELENKIAALRWVLGFEGDI